MSVPNLSNKFNELCQRLARLEKLVAKGIIIETDHPDTTETSVNLPLGGVLRFTSNGSISQDLTKGSAICRFDNDSLRTGCGAPSEPAQLAMNLKICSDRHNFMYLDLKNVELWMFVNEDKSSPENYGNCGLMGSYIQLTGSNIGNVISLYDILVGQGYPECVSLIN